jgi:hypothetical protein
MRRLVLPMIVTVAIGCGACTQPAHRSLEAYHDPAGLFSTSLPDANEVTVIPASPAEGGVEVLSGVTSAPTAQGASSPLGGGDFQLSQPDQAVFFVYVLRIDAVTDPRQLADLMLGSSMGFVTDEETTVSFGNGQGLLRVGHIDATDRPAAGLAGGFLVADGISYVVVEAFPEDQWSAQRDDFLKVLASFRPGAPPGVATVPLSPAA